MQIEDSYPLSPIQHGMLVHSLSAPQSGVYIQQLVSVLREELNVIAFQRAWEQVLRRHPALRTSFYWEGTEQPVQRVHRDALLPFQNLDWSDRALDDQEKQLECFLQTDRQLEFHLDQPPLIRLTLVRCAQAEYRLIWTSHHALFDGRSRLLLLNEVFAFYEAICRGENLNLSNPSPYRSYIDWLQKQNISEAENFWRTRLKGLNAGQSLAGNHRQPTPPQVQSYGKKTTRLSETVTRALRSLVEQYQLTPNTLLQGAWALLLSRYSREDHVVFGAIRAGRHAPLEGAESMIGLLINTVPIPVHVPPNSRLLPWLNSLRSHWITMRDFEHTPLVKIHDWSHIPSGKPLFESLVVFENYQLNALMHEQGDRWKNREFYLLGTTHYPLTVAGYLGPDLSLELTYDRQRFDDETITRMLNHLRTLLVEMVCDPNRRLLDLPLLSPAEQHQVLVEWNDTKRDYPKGKCIQELFEEQVERSPASIALVFEDRRVTYRELNIKANQLAYYLGKLGVGPDDLVGICMDRSVEMVIGLLSILKAGGAYVPLDPSYPKERLRFMLEDTHASIVLTDMVSQNSLPPTSARVICLDRDWEEIAKEPRDNPESESTTNSLAYVIYTSGSTGVPKGVEVPHRGVVRLLFGVDCVRLDPRQTFLHLAPISFDAATFELWGALLHGSKCVLFPGKVPSGKALGVVLKQHRVNTLWLTAALFNTVVNEAPQALSEVKQLLIGGEALSVPDVRKGLALLPNTEIINGYGPTESTTFTCCYGIPRELDDRLSSIPIGRPIGNTQVYLLDADLNPVPIGVAGELHVGGDGLARGYLNRPELTAEKFISNPFTADPTSRLYKTGDLARYLPDGNIEFLGRIDNQVKLRGYRIELGEIEAVLGQHLAVRAAVVLAREDNPEDPAVSPGTAKRLVAYVVARPDTSTNELRSFLKQKLPEYMIPSAFVFLESLPLTPNGKVDCKALPVPDQARPELEAIFVRPRNPVEEMLAEIWAEVLRVERIGIHDNFFELGGHSLLATQVISRIRRALQMEIPLRALFETPTVAGLAERIEEVRGQGQGLHTLPMFATYPQERIPLSFAQQRLWFLDQYEPNSSVYNIPSALRLKGALDVSALEQSLKEIVRRHESLRTTFSLVDGEPVQVIAPTLKISLPFTDLMDLPESDRENEAQRLAMEQAREPFDLSQGPLLRVMLLRLGEDDHVLVLTMHHIVSDGWSRGVLYRELSLLYQAYTQGNPSFLSELSIQYADFAVWQRQWLQGEVLENQLSYWKKQLAGAPAILNLPTDRPRPAVQSYRGASQSIELSQELTQGLKALSARQGVTLFMTLLAAFQTLLHRYTGQNDIVVGSPIANRNRAEIEGLIGFFVNTLVMRTDLSGNPTFKELLTRVRETALGAYTHQDLPFEKLVEELHPQRSLSHSPLFQVLFNLLENQNDRLLLPGLDASPFGTLAIPSKFDLTLYAIPKPQRLTLTINYNSDLLDDASINRMLGHLCNLLEAITTDCSRRLLELLLLAEDEKRQLLVEWSGSEPKSPEHRCIHQLFEAQVERTPDAIALTDEHQSLTYRDLNRRANQFAHHLRKRGVVTGDLIPIFMERCCDMVIAVLGILKVGAAYVPLDFDYPRMRLAYMLEDTRATLLVTSARCLNRLPEHKGEIICLDRDRRLFDREAVGNPTLPTGAAEISYVYYTSGSTGTPKGVLAPHRGVVRYCDFLANTYNLNSADIVLQLASFSFDASFRDLIAPLTVGAAVVLVDQEGAKDPTLLISQIKQHRVTCLLSTVPPMLNELAETMLAEERTGHDSLRLILVSGEALHGSLCRKVREAFGENTLLVNQYGPTECTMTSSYHPISLADHQCPTAPIGRPIPHAELYVLDDALNPTPVGIEGELYIGGEGLAVGYLNRSDLTAEKFIPNPYGNKPGERLYRTGDVVRYRSDGTFAFVGRSDRQVKIRSIRVELGEIESVLSQHPSVREAVVLAREDKSGEKQLVAYVLPGQELTPSTLDLQNYLKQKLPEYMVPYFFVFLDSLPLTPNGKVDRKSLPPPDMSRRELNENFAAPRTVVEKTLAELCAEVLKIDKVGIHDNFFDLGLHSLSATQLTSRVRGKLRVKLPLRNIFEAPTIAGLAQLIEKLAHESADRPSGSRTIAEPELIPKRARIDSHSSHPVDECAKPLSIERRSLLSLLATGKIAPVDAAALSYLSEDLLQRLGLPLDTALNDWFDDLPCVFGINETHLGRIAIIGLPRLRSRLYDDQADLVSMIFEALEISHRVGGRVVSLTGLIPSATNYGQAIADVISRNDRYPLVTTGHATTVSTVVLTIERILREGGKSLAEENVAFLGLGSIGYTTLRLMLHSLPHPKSIMLCDIYSRLDHLKKVRDDLIRDLRFGGSVHIVESDEMVRGEIYDAGLVIGATNVPDVLNIEQLKPGTLIVDDSAPHCFNPDEAIKRFEAHEDILFTAGGVLRLPQPFQRTLYLPQRVQEQIPPAVLEAMSKYHPFHMGGCVLSGLLTARYESLKPTLGVVDDDSCKLHYQLLQRLGYQAASLQCRGYTLPEESVRGFRKRFGYV